jgi:hypothetical protein
MPDNVALSVDFNHAIVELVSNESIVTRVELAILRCGRKAAADQESQDTCAFHQPNLEPHTHLGLTLASIRSDRSPVVVNGL